MTISQFVSALTQILNFFVSILYKAADLYSTNPVFAAVIALFVLDRVIDLFKYIIKS